MKICITGAGGFVGTHVTRVCLEAGHEVRALVRAPHTPARVGHLEILPGAAERLSLQTGDIMDPESLDTALAGCDALIHTAANAKLAARDPQREIVDVAERGTRNVLECAAAAGSVERVVLTSSESAMIGYDKPEGHVFGVDDWCDDATLENNPYGVAKRESERTFWRILERHPHMAGVSINPGLVVGPVHSERHLESSISVVRDIVARTYPGHPPLWHNVVDAEAVAQAHLRALCSEQATGKRYVLSAGGMWWYQLAELLAERYQVRTNQLPRWAVWLGTLVDPRASWSVLAPMLGRALPLDGSPAERELGIQYASIRSALEQAADSLCGQGLVRARPRPALAPSA